MLFKSNGSKLPRPFRRGFTLIEAMTVITMMAILSAMAVPSFQRALEESKADITVANLRAIWSAERFYWMANRQYCNSITELVTEGLLDSSLNNSTIAYSYSITTDPDNATFTATATRVGSSVWSGFYTINELGVISGAVGASNELNLTISQQ